MEKKSRQERITFRNGRSYIRPSLPQIAVDRGRGEWLCGVNLSSFVRCQIT